MFKIALLLAGVLMIAGCAIETPTATPTTASHGTPVVPEPTIAPTWPARFEPPTADSRIAELHAWDRALAEAGPVRGVSWGSVDERNHRIEIGMLPLRGARKEMEAAIARANVPREAVVIGVGCRAGALWRLNTGRDPKEEFLDAIDYSLEVASKVSYGDTVPLKLTLRNTRNKPVQLPLAAYRPMTS